MSTIRKRLHPSGVSKFSTARKKLRSSACDCSTLSLTPSSQPPSSPSRQCHHSNTVNLSSPMQLRRRKSAGKTNLQGERSGCSYVPELNQRDQWVPGELYSNDLHQSWTEPGLFDEEEEDGDFYTHYPAEYRLMKTILINMEKKKGLTGSTFYL